MKYWSSSVFAQRFGHLRDTPVVIGVFKRFGKRLVFLVAWYPSEFRVSRRTVVIGIHRRDFASFIGVLDVETFHAFEIAVNNNGDGMVADHAPGFIALQQPHGQQMVHAPDRNAREAN